jgi:Ca2+-binding RTX toxin-like protein
MMIGGLGADRLVDNMDDDVQIAGSTAFDADPPALAAILAAWLAPESYADRTAALREVLRAEETETGLATVVDDGSADVLTGSAGQDWFLFQSDGDKKDKVTDLSAAGFAADLDFIADL